MASEPPPLRATPGPYVVEFVPDGTIQFIVCNGQRNHIAISPASPRPVEESLANGYLLAASWELYEAAQHALMVLRSILAHTPDDQPAKDAELTLSTAIERARGGQIQSGRKPDDC